MTPQYSGRKSRVYLAGPMRDIEDFNFPAFHSATIFLRQLGYEVFNAAEEEEKIFGVGFNKSKTGNLKDIEHLDWDFREAFFKDCEYITRKADYIVCLPGWEKSKGATAEVAIARALGISVHSYPSLNQIQFPAVALAAPRSSVFPADKAERKTYPVATGCLDYFPDALAAIANLSYVGNEQHNPGTPIHWDRSKSTDEADAMIRHFLDRGSRDVDGVRHSAKMVWRGLAILQKELENEHH